MAANVRRRKRKKKPSLGRPPMADKAMCSRIMMSMPQSMMVRLEGYISVSEPFFPSKAQVLRLALDQFLERQEIY